MTKYFSAWNFTKFKVELCKEIHNCIVHIFITKKTVNMLKTWMKSTLSEKKNNYLDSQSNSFVTDILYTEEFFIFLFISTLFYLKKM